MGIPVTDNRCDSCMFYVNDAICSGTCHAHAPVADPSDKTIWPVVLNDDFCGDWLARHDVVPSNKKSSGRGNILLCPICGKDPHKPRADCPEQWRHQGR
jgi:hypothetical protein